MFCDYLKALQKSVPCTEKPMASLIKYSWCSARTRGAGFWTFTLLQRYHFRMASLLLPCGTLRPKQAAETFNLTPHFEIPYQIICQRLAARTVQQCLMSHTLHHVKMAFVLLCTEPSGHGKTELVKPMRGLLSLPFLEIDLTHLHHETDFFEAPAPCQGWKKMVRD